MASSSRNITIISATWHEWNFGYEVYLPLSVTIDNLTVENKKQIYVLGNYIGDAGNDLDRVLNSQVNKPHITKEITIKNNASGLSFVASINQSLSKEIPLTEKSGES